eukprot:5364061-Pleurochrysis_carterae.AAC.1
MHLHVAIVGWRADAAVDPEPPRCDGAHRPQRSKRAGSGENLREAGALWAARAAVELVAPREY